MQPLQRQDALHLEAAQGWLQLGNHIEANGELDNITTSLRAHPDVLKVRWEVYAAAKKWEGALEIAAALIQLEPGGPLGLFDSPPQSGGIVISHREQIWMARKPHAPALAREDSNPRVELQLRCLSPW